MDGRLKGQVALVTGAGGGIGRAICARYLQEGAQVVALDINPDGARAAVEGGGSAALALTCDVGDTDSVVAAVAGAQARFGRLTVLCNTAGGSTPADGPVTEVAESEFWRAIRLDLFGTFLICKYGIPGLMRAGGGSVITMASILGQVGIAGKDCYTAAKGGIMSLTRSMAVEYAPRGIRVNAIAPGITLTPRVVGQMEAGNRHAALEARHLLGAVQPVDVAEMAVFLASPESCRVTGQILSVDSGASAS